MKIRGLKYLRKVIGYLTHTHTHTIMMYLKWIIIIQDYLYKKNKYLKKKTKLMIAVSSWNVKTKMNLV